jgi:acyl-[acyl-carrier-protein]-phospholipid O-acyltransferase / long-chain-fatty-acid--[acyl-carrier-protein] ligase
MAASPARAPSLWRRFVRALAVRLIRSVYRIRASGLEHLPRDGALLVANHLSHVDALVLGAALHPLEPRFLMHRSFFAVPLVGSFSRWMGAMPVASEDSPEQKAEALARAAAAAKAGELVCIFAEGGISRSGALRPFARGLEIIARDARVPIVPVALDRLWGSLFSFSEGRFFWKWPKRVPFPVDIVIGTPMPPDSERWQVRDAVAELIARAREARMPRTRSLGHRFVLGARRHAGRIAVADASGAAVSYRRLLRSVLVARAALRKGTSLEGRLEIRMPAGVDSVIVHAAAALCGRTVVSLGADEVVTSARELESRASVADRIGAGLLAFCPGIWLARSLDRVRDGLRPAAVLPDRVVLSHASLASTAVAVAQMFRIGPGEVVFGALPLSSALGSVATMWVPILSGACAVHCADPRDPKSVEDACIRARPTVVVATPGHYREWLEAVSTDAFASVRLYVCGGEPLDRALSEAWRARFGVELCEGYGCNELASVVSVNLPGIESSDARQNASKPGTVGRAIPGVAVRVVDPETFALLPPEREGLLLARGPGRMIGYEGEPERTARVLRDGWFVTGDRAMLDKDAFVVLAAPRADADR